MRKESTMPETTRHDESAWRPRVKFVFLAFALIGAFFLIAEHRAHVLPWLPWLFLAACPLMHVFMHHGHGGHHQHGDRGDSGGRPNSSPGPPQPPHGQQS
jgi:hypothetical protein